MNENIDLTKILYGCPRGTELYNTVYGKVRFLWVDFLNKLPIVISTYSDVIIHLTKEGRLISTYDGECTLFPSKDQRDWFKFMRFWDKPKVKRFNLKTLQSFDRILVRDDDSTSWKCELFSHINTKRSYPITCIGHSWKYCIPYNDETKHLIGTTDDCPEYYKWWEE